MILAAEGIRVSYPGQQEPALQEVSCGVGAGELLGVVGPNGSGKTTLLRALLGTVSLQAGKAWIKARPIGEWRRAELGRVVGVVTQREEQLFPLRVRETVMLGRYPHLGPTAAERPVDRDAVEEAMQRCDVATLSDRRVDSLSGGEWQRVRVARALAQEPEALVLDEPSAALDVRHEMEVFELIHHLVAGGLAGIVVTHHLNLAARYCHRLLLLDRGRVAAVGSPGEVLGQALVSRVFDWPVAIMPWCQHAPQVVPLRPGEV